eukprot:4104432-Pleurochrysis_carterae.AAC.2
MHPPALPCVAARRNGNRISCRRHGASSGATRSSHPLFFDCLRASCARPSPVSGPGLSWALLGLALGGPSLFATSRY